MTLPGEDSHQLMEGYFVDWNLLSLDKGLSFIVRDRKQKHELEQALCCVHVKLESSKEFSVPPLLFFSYFFSE